MVRKATWPPPIYPHKRDGVDRCRVWINGKPKDYTLGPIGSEESKEAYRRLLAELERAPDATPARKGSPLAALLNQYDAHARGRYGPQQYYRIHTSLAPIISLYGTLPPDEFGPKRLKVIQQQFAGKYCRRLCNQMLGCIKQAFRWLVSEELIDVDVLRKLETVQGLRKVGDAVREPKKIRIPDWSDVEKTIPHLTVPLRAAVWFQRWTGCRPGEAVLLRPCDIILPWKEVGGVELWLYRLDSHKTAWRGGLREIPIGPRAQAVLQPFLDRDPEAYCFSPKEGLAEWYARKRAARKTPVQPSQKNRKRGYRSHEPGGHYTTGSYAQSVARACELNGITHWHPNQLRHLVGTEIEGVADRDAARCVLGHSSPQTTAVYAESVEKAAGLMAVYG